MSSEAQSEVPDVSIVIPIFNEFGNIEPLYAEIRDVMLRSQYTFEQIWVDDGSTDGSTARIRELKDSISICLARNYGQTTALSAGIERANGRLIAFLDGDKQNDPSDIPRMISKLDELGIDALCGWRVERKDSFGKKVISKGAYYLRQYFTKDGIHDAGCTLKVIRRDAAKSLELAGEMHRFIPALLKSQGWRIDETPVNHRPRYWGSTKYNLKRVIKSYLDMVSLWFWGRFVGRPLHLLGSIGVICLGTGSILGLVWLTLSLTGSTFLRFSLPSISIFLCASGIQFFFTGILLDQISRIRAAQLGTKAYRVLDN